MANEEHSSAATSPDLARRRRRWRRAVWAAAIACVLYVIVGFLGVPLIIHHIVVPQINQAIHGTLTLDKARTNPFTWRLQLEGMKLVDMDQRPIASFARFDGGLRVLDTIFSRGWHFQRAVLTDPTFAFEVERSRANTLSKLLKPVPPDPKAPPREPMKHLPRIVVGELGIVSGDVAFRDEVPPEPFAIEWNDLMFSITNLDTDPIVNNPHRLEARTATGEKLVWEGTLFLDPLSSEGTIVATGLDLSRAMPYAMPYTTARITSAKFAGKVSYEFAPTRSPGLARATATGVVLSDLVVQNAGEPVLNAKELRIDHASADVHTNTARVGVVQLTGIDAKIRRGKEGSLELVEMLRAAPLPQRIVKVKEAADRAAATKPPRDPKDPRPTLQELAHDLGELIQSLSKPWKVSVERVEVTDTRATLADASSRRPVELALSDMTVKAGSMTNADMFATDIELAAKVQGAGNLSLRGRVEPGTPAMDVVVNAERLPLASIAAYLPAEFAAEVQPMELADGFARLDGRARLNASAGVSAEWHGELGVTGLRATGASGDIAQLGSLALSGKATANLGEQGLAAATWDGTIKAEAVDLKQPLRQAIAFEGVAPMTLERATLGVEGTLKASVEGSTLSAAWNGVATVADAEASPVARLRSARVQGSLTFATGSGLRLEWNGAAGVEGLAATLTGDGTSPSATLEHAGFEGSVSMPSAGELAVKGRADVAGVEARLPTPEAQATIRSIAAEGLDANLAARSVALSRVAIDGPMVAASLALLPPPKDPNAKVPPSPAERVEARAMLPALPMALLIGELRVTGGALQVRDVTAQPPLQLSSDEIEITATSLSSQPGQPGELRVTARLQATGRAEIAGTIDPFVSPPSADVKLKLGTLPLKPFDPVSGRFVGYMIDDGRMTLQLPVKASEGKVNGTIGFNFDRLQLGQSVPSPEAPNLPIKFGLDLLRDSKGQISGSIPFSGDLTDPKFSMGGIIWQAFLGLIGNIATSPFKALGSIFGAAEGQDLSFIPFEPGSAELSDKARATLDVLGKALTDRPALQLKVVPTFDAKDREALARALLRQQIQGKSKQLSPEQFERSLKRLHEEKLPPDPTLPRKDRPVLSLEEMETALVPTIEVPEAGLIDLATRRGQASIDVMVKDHAIAPERVTMGEPISAETSAVRFELPR